MFLVATTVAATMAFTSFLSGCGPSYKNIKVNPARSRQHITLGHSDFKPSQNRIYHYRDKIKKHWVIVDPYETKVKKKGNLFYLRNDLELVPPTGSKRIRTKRGLERVMGGIYYKPLEIVTTVSPESKERSIAGHIYEGRDPDSFDDKYSRAEAERLPERKIKGKPLKKKIKGRLPKKKIKINVKYYKERKEGGDGGNGGNGGSGGGVGGGGGSGGSGGG